MEVGVEDDSEGKHLASRAIARCMHVGWYSVVHVKSEVNQVVRMLLTNRRTLRIKQIDIENEIRGTRGYLGSRVTACLQRMAPLNQKGPPSNSKGTSRDGKGPVPDSSNPLHTTNRHRLGADKAPRRFDSPKAKAARAIFLSAVHIMANI